MSRKTDPRTRYRVYIHNNKNYRYAAVQVPQKSEESNVSKYRVLHIGTVDKNLIFTPNASFMLMDISEREKYIFPSDWDISKCFGTNIEKISKEEIEKNNCNKTIKDSSMQTNTDHSISKISDKIRGRPAQILH